MAEWGGANESLKEDDRKRGLYGKYNVTRADGKEPGRCFVLAYDKDPHARAALIAYIESCREEYPQLAADLVAELTPDPRGVWATWGGDGVGP